MECCLSQLRREITFFSVSFSVFSSYTFPVNIGVPLAFDFELLFFHYSFHLLGTLYLYRLWDYKVVTPMHIYHQTRALFRTLKCTYPLYPRHFHVTVAEESHN